MLIRAFKQCVVFMFAVAGCCLTLARPAAAGDPNYADRVYVDGVAMYDSPCNQPSRTLCQSMCRKFKLHGIYFRRACTQRYIGLPYTQPDSAAYFGSGMNDAAYCMPAPVNADSRPPVAAPAYPTAGDPVNYGGVNYGNVNYGFGPSPAYSSPAYAPPGTVFIR